MKNNKINRLNVDNFQCVPNLEEAGHTANFFEYGIESEVRDIVYKINEIIDKLNETSNKEIAKLRKELKKEKNKNRQLNHKVEYYFNRNYKYQKDIAEIGIMLNLDPGTMNDIKNQIRKKYCSLDKGSDKE